MRLYGSFAKVDRQQRVVSGYASTERVDRAGEIVLKSAIEDALDDYLQFPTVRQMHQLNAVGKTIEASMDDRGLYISAKIVDDAAWTKVTEGVFLGFSIGGKVLARDPKDRSVITKVRLDEISLVDRPSNPEAVIDLVRAAGLDNGFADVAKITMERDVLAEQLAKRDGALAKFADRSEAIVKRVNGIAKENQRLQRENAALAKRLATVQPRVVNPEALNKTLEDLETIILPKLETDTALLRARFDHQERGGRLDA